MRKLMLYRFFRNETGTFSASLAADAPCTPALPLFFLLPELTQSAMAGLFSKPIACLVGGVLYTTLEFAQKTYAKPVGGRGISAFLVTFFFTHGF